MMIDEEYEAGLCMSGMFMAIYKKQDQA